MSRDRDVVIGGCLAAIIITPLLTLLEAWALMLAVGALHHEVESRVPAYGFWQVVIVVLVINIIGTIVRGTKSSGESK